MRRFLLLFVSILFACPVEAHNSASSDTLGITLYFHQSSSLLDDAFRCNGVRFAKFSSRLDTLLGDVRCRIGNIRIISGASAEGSTTFNRQLSTRRGEQLKALLEQCVSLQDCDFEFKPLGVDWVLLDRLVSASDMPYRNGVLHILRNTPEWISRGSKVVDGRKLQLKKLRGGTVWNSMLKNFFPELRYARAEIVYEIEEAPAASAADILPLPYTFETSTVTSHSPRGIVAAMPLPAPPEPPKKPFYMSVRNNMLYDIALVPNLGMEFYLGSGWSLAGEWMYAWWKTDRYHYYWRIYGGDLGIRKWFGGSSKRKPLTGHHAGIYGQISTYDFELGGRGYLAPRWSWGAGLEYGYALPVSRRLNIDFVIGAGYFDGEYYEYIPLHNLYVWQATKQRHYLGITKAEISLVWLLGRGNVNEKKGRTR